MQHSEQINELATALAAAQNDFVSAKKDVDNPYFKSKYADLASITEAVKPAAKHGLAHTQFVSTDPERKLVIVTTMLMHKSGQWIKDSFALPVPEWKPQPIGSSTTYGRRYGLQAAYGLAAEDDDGNAASASPAKQSATAPAKPAKKQEDARGNAYYEESPDGSEARFRVSSVKEDVSKKSNHPYLRVEYGPNRGESVFCFDTKLMEEIKTWKTGDVATVALETTGNYRSITQVNDVKRGQLSTATDAV